MTLTNARTKVWTEPKGPDQKRADLRFMEVSGQVASFVDFFGDVLGTFLFCWEGVILQSLKLRAFFWGLAPPSLGVIFFGDCMHPMSFLGIVVREVSIGKLLRIGNHPQNGNATHAVTLVLDLNLFEPPSSSHWGVAIDTMFTGLKVVGPESKPSLGNLKPIFGC